MDLNELPLFIKLADSYSAEQLGFRLELEEPDQVHSVEGGGVRTCSMKALEFRDVVVGDIRFRMLILQDERNQMLTAAHPYDLARLFN